MAIVALFAASAATNPTYDAPCQGEAYHLAKGRALVSSAFTAARWRDKTPMRAREAAAYRHHKFCLTTQRDKLTEFRRQAAKHHRADRHRRLFRARYTPFYCPGHGWFAVECYIVARESGYDKHAENPSSTAGGWYQIIDSTWYTFGGSRNGCYHVAACASAREQHTIGSRIRADGVQHWSASAPG